jgi:hypothetical protein
MAGEAWLGRAWPGKAIKAGTTTQKENNKMTEQKTRNELVAEEVDRLIKKHGFVSTDLLVSEARKKSNPLHGLFVWDDSIAAEKYRLSQAAEMIRAVEMIRIVNKRREPTTIRAFLPMIGGESIYKTREVVLAHVESREMFINRQIGVLRAWCRETADVDELAELRSVISRTLGNFDEKRGAV